MIVLVFCSLPSFMFSTDLSGALLRQSSDLGMLEEVGLALQIPPRLSGPSWDIINVSVA